MLGGTGARSNPTLKFTFLVVLQICKEKDDSMKQEKYGIINHLFVVESFFFWWRIIINSNFNYGPQSFSNVQLRLVIT